jgi:tripartite-type tricarboxylate transporter receptor subunit TctC
MVTTDGIPGLLPHVKGGRLRALAVTSAQRLPGLDIPTVAETYPGYEVIGWFQVMAPTGTPAVVVERVNQDVNRILQQPDLVTRLNEMGIYPRNDSLPAAKTFFTDQQRAMKKLVADLGIQPQ